VFWPATVELRHARTGACHSGGFTADGSALASNADLLRWIMVGNVTVLTFSTAKEVSREGENWNHGAFMRVLLDALGGDADETHSGLVPMSDLTRYISTRVPALTANIIPASNKDLREPFSLPASRRLRTRADPDRSDAVAIFP
jgi:hypothetical protein